jgi:hypothetical protein
MIVIPPPEKIPPKIYSWEKDRMGKFSKITKEFFRCKGCSLNPPQPVQRNGETTHTYDCKGADKHSLPLRDGKEFVYPILLELVNHIQELTGKRLVITCGHRCPEHNTYADPSLTNQYSKHMIGAEVSFYVQGLEEHPELIVKILQDYYKTHPNYQNDNEYTIFKRYDNSSDVAILPWYNKEIFIKLYAKHEGRNFDNRHPYPYLSIQVRYDRDTKERVIYTWDKAHRNYMRW